MDLQIVLLVVFLVVIAFLALFPFVRNRLRP
jgi:hypothetical protein